MTDTELLDKVKDGLGVSGSYSDKTLLPKVIAVKQYMANAGISQQNIESELGMAALTVGVSDLWNLSSGDVKFSKAFDILLTQLNAASLPDPS